MKGFFVITGTLSVAILSWKGLYLPPVDIWLHTAAILHAHRTWQSDEQHTLDEIGNGNSLPHSLQRASNMEAKPYQFFLHASVTKSVISRASRASATCCTTCNIRNMVSQLLAVDNPTATIKPWIWLALLLNMPQFGWSSFSVFPLCALVLFLFFIFPTAKRIVNGMYIMHCEWVIINIITSVM